MANKYLINYTVKTEDGRLVDCSLKGRPASVSIGEGSLPAKLEEYILNMSQGEKSVFVLTPDELFGDYSEDNVLTIDKKQFEDFYVSDDMIGQFIELSDSDGNVSRGLIVKIDEQNIDIDFNHPLAGKHLTYEIHLEEIL